MSGWESVLARALVVGHARETRECEETAPMQRVLALDQIEIPPVANNARSASDISATVKPPRTLATRPFT